MSTGQALDTARWDFEGNLVHVFSAVIGVVHIHGKYVQLMESPAPVVVATTILLVSALKTANLKTLVTDPLGDNKVEAPKTARNVTHVQTSDQETFITPTCMPKKKSTNHPTIKITAICTHWKHKFTALQPSKRQNDTSQTYHFPQPATHSSK